MTVIIRQRMFPSELSVEMEAVKTISLSSEPGKPIQITPKNRVELIRGGKPYFELLKKLIVNAEHTIHLQTYIYDDDITGKEIAEALKEAAARNVRIYLMADGYASQVMSQLFIDQLRQARINFRFFKPILKSKYFYVGRRLHHKLFVADNRFALVGGMNISDRYNDFEEKPAWLDFALYIEGDAAREVAQQCYNTWNNFQKLRWSKEIQTEKQITAAIPSTVFIRSNDWVRRKYEISSTYLQILKTAKKEITILCSYFIPGRMIRKYLLKAAKRGVKIKIVMAGRSDVMLAKYAERFIYKDLLKNNIEIYEYQKSVLHGKIAICDNEWLTIGSYNINDISAYASIEVNADVYDPAFCQSVNELIKKIIKEDCILITSGYLNKKNNLFNRAVHWISYEIVRLLIYFFTFYYKQKV